MRIAGLFHGSLYRLSFKYLLMTVILLLLTKFTSGVGAVIIATYGITSALKRYHANTLMCFCLLSIMSILNPMVFSFGTLLNLSTRVGIPCMTLAMLMDPSLRSKRMVIPLQSITVYVLVAMFSSFWGYAPMISLFKVINFAVFIGGIYLGCKLLGENTIELAEYRGFFFAMATLVLLGSLLLNYVNPFAAHYTAYGWHIAREGVESARRVMESQMATTGNAGYFCGILNHSQCLGPTVACIAGWLLCDMIFVERRIMFGHLLLICLCPVELYMTASRTSLLGFFVAVMVISLYCVPQLRISPQMKLRLRCMTFWGLFVLIICGVILEYRSNGMTKWLVKPGYSSVNAENDITFERLTSSRQLIIAESFRDFTESPLLGKGFQVSKEHEILAQTGLFVLSAPIEKGFLPTMILGETGLLGALAFLLFLTRFYHGCIHSGYWVIIALFSTMLATNLGEATFFSPGGMGGTEWLFAIVGGLVVDKMCQRSLRPDTNGIGIYHN